MRALRILPIGLFIAAVPVFLITANVRWVIGSPLLYGYGFDRYDIPSVTGIERDELLSAARQIREYFGNDEELLTVSVVRYGVRVDNLYNSKEVLHMKDVKGLVRLVYGAQWATGLYLVAFALAGWLVYRRTFPRLLARYAAYGGAATVGLVIVVGLASLIGFDRLFLVFHLISFSNDLWQLDPRTDYLIAMFPQGFFLDATLWIAGATVMQACALAAAAVLYLRSRRTPVDGSPAVAADGNGDLRDLASSPLTGED